MTAGGAPEAIGKEVESHPHGAFDRKSPLHYRGSRLDEAVK
jgi:hypothetical protein